MDISSATLKTLAREWIVEHRARPSVACPPWARELFGEDWEGRRWVSGAAYDWLTEADRAHLQKKEIQVTRNGKTFTTTVYVRTDGTAPDEGKGRTDSPAPHGAKSPPPSKSEATVRVSTFSPGAAERLPGVLGKIIGPGAKPEHAADAIGATSGDVVKIGQARTLEDGKEFIAVTIKTPDGISASRSLNYDPKTGKRWIVNDTIHAPEELQGKGRGTEMFARQVERAAALGFDHVEAGADRGSKNGYYTLPRWGYDGPIPGPARAKLPPGLAGAKSLLDLMDSPAGREWWKSHGEPVDVKFDLSDGSRSRKTLAAYVAARAAKPAAEARRVELETQLRAALRAYTAERLSFVPPGSVDRANGIVRNVRVIGPRSGNGRKYPPHVIAKYAHLYDNVPVNVGHHIDPATGMPTEVPPYDKFGKLVNPRPFNSGLNADLAYNPEHPFAKPFLWACEHAPAMYMFSVLHRVGWSGRPDADGDLVAESILEVRSVDIVTEGGTTNSVFESLSTAWRRPVSPPPPPAPAPPSIYSTAIAEQMRQLIVGDGPRHDALPPVRPKTARELVAAYNPDRS